MAKCTTFSIPPELNGAFVKTAIRESAGIKAARTELQLQVTLAQLAPEQTAYLEQVWLRDDPLSIGEASEVVGKSEAATKDFEADVMRSLMKLRKK